MTDWVYRQPHTEWYYGRDTLLILGAADEATIQVPNSMFNVDGKVPAVSTSQQEALTDVPQILPIPMPQGGGVYREVIAVQPFISIVSEPSAGGGDVQIAPPTGNMDFVGQQPSLANKIITAPLGQFEFNALAARLFVGAPLFEGLRRHAGRLLR